MKIKIILMLLSLVFVISCGEIEQGKVDLHGKLFQFKVDVLNAPETTQLLPANIPYHDGEFQVEIKVTALDFYGEKVTDLKNQLRVYTSTGTCNPGNISASDFIDGETTLTVSLLKTFDESYIIVEDSGNGVIGVSDEDKKFYFKGLDIYDIQLPSNSTADASNFFNDSYIRISQNTDPDGSNPHKNLMVIYASGSGMYIIDTDRMHINEAGDNTGACMIKDGTGNWIKNPNFEGYSTMYVYSRNAPINFDGDSSVGAGEEDFKYLRAGHKLDWFSGNLVEFPPGISNGMTEMGFPLWEMISGEMDLDESVLDERMKDIPICELDHSEFVAGRNDATNIKNLERYESNIVEIKDVQIGTFDANNKDYKIYSQWQVYPIGTDITATDKPTFRVVSINGASEFDLMFHQNKDENCTGENCEKILKKGTQISYVRGILHHVYSDIWVIYLRSKCDIKLKDDSLGGWNNMINNDPECNK